MGVGLLPALAAGASLCLIEKNNVIKFMDSANRFRPTITLITPAFAKMLLKLNKPVEARSLYISAGEKLSPTAYREFESLLGPLYNLYGCTEMGAIAVSPQEENLSMSRQEGMVRALPSVEVVIDGEGGGPILCRHPAGCSSYIDGEGKITSVPNSMDGWYKTMDMGEAAGGGCFYVRGRLDNCINRSGFLVSMDEMAVALERVLPGVSQVVVLKINDPGAAEDRLLAICEAAGDGRPEGPVLKKICRESMNKYQIPDEFHFVGSLPRLQNGKPDRAAMIRAYTNH
jgi:acyl-coenzyme A synthetase/AMP-(fatty) acid ligase